MATRRPRAPKTLFVLLSFEGPDQYSQAGGLGVRVKELARALARLGHETHLYFVGDPALPADESSGALHLHRWSQWISAYHPHGVYDGEEGKKLDWDSSLPGHVAERIVDPARRAGFRVAVVAEDWQTADTLIGLDRELRRSGLRDGCVLIWNANNVFGNWRIDFPALERAATLTTVSRYMKFRMWEEGVNPLVVPNGIPREAIADPPPEEVAALRAAAGGGPLLFKIGRFDPDKRWLMAIEAVAALKARGRRPRLLMRGGREQHGAEVLARARALRLKHADVRPGKNAAELAAAIKAAPADADVLNFAAFLPEPVLPSLYRAADAVLANSGHEPFGLVGLEVMAAGGLAVTGSTGEDYAEPFRNALVMETEDPLELAESLQLVERDRRFADSLRRGGRATARAFTWDRVIPQLFARLEYAADRQGTAF
jgi:D-inositol-3-phosphate glycosyltransferase